MPPGLLTSLWSRHADKVHQRSFNEYNLELSAVVRSATFGAQMQDLFENDVLYSKKINLKAWRRRPTWDRFVQWTVSRARYLL